jgi:hypothetical protein
MMTTRLFLAGASFAFAAGAGRAIALLAFAAGLAGRGSGHRGEARTHQGRSHAQANDKLFHDFLLLS